MIRHGETWSTTNIPSNRQFHSFQEVLDRTHFHWALKGAQKGPYMAHVARRSIDDFVFTRVVADPVMGRRSLESIRQDKEPYFCLLYFEEGRVDFQQGANTSRVGKDTVCLWDSTRPAFFEQHERSCQVSILFPHKAALSAVPGIEDLCGASVDGSTGLGSLLLSHLKRLHASIDTIADEDRPAVLRATMELVGAAFRPELPMARNSGFRRALMGRIQDYMASNLHDPGLSASSIAAAFRISPSYLHRLFKEIDVSVGEWIRKRRLQAARQALAPSASTKLAVTEVAMRFGFSDASHFSHAFKREFGIAPIDYRNGKS